MAIGATAEELPDPMRPPDSRATDTPENNQETSRPSLELQSTLIAGGRRSAVINGQSVQVGSTIEGARVVAIEGGKVELRDDQGVFSVRLPSVGMRTKVPKSNAN